ncbi:MAG: 2-hydroxy-3-oxopropionate reductase [Negativicutes bacterium]|nr:2-hydroxy-3-oxopropionate reductase [Negativicutes bacterium]
MGKIGFIGLGVMGKPMSKNLLKAGYQLVVYDLYQPAVAELVSAGAEAANSPRAVAEQCDKIVTMLPNSPHVRQALLGENGVIESAKPGTIIIDASSIAPIAAREIAAKLAEKQIGMLDAPVSGGQAGAEKGTLSIMVGGEKAVFDECAPILNAVGGNVVWVGAIGAGNVAKLTNQAIVAINIAAVAEGMTLAVKAGVDPEVVFQAIRGGSAASRMLENKTPLMLAQKFDPGFRLNLHIKDLGNVLETGHEVGAPLPLSSTVMEMMQNLKADQLGDCDNSVLVKYYEKLAGTMVKGHSAE